MEKDFVEEYQAQLDYLRTLEASKEQKESEIQYTRECIALMEKFESLLKSREPNIDKADINARLKEFQKKSGEEKGKAFAILRFVNVLNILDHPAKQRIFQDVLFEELEKLGSTRAIPRIVLGYEGIRYMLQFLCMPTGRSLSGFGTKMMDKLYRYARTDLPVLIMGETGTSKSYFARAIHSMSMRRGKQMVEVDCAALPEDLIESELFGHQKGAFTGAAQKKTGLLKVADGSTVLLDELGKMPRHLQTKLLKAIEEKRFRPLGSTELVHSDFRTIAIVQPKNISSGEIIPDLLYRLGGLLIRTPTLGLMLARGETRIFSGSLEEAEKKLVKMGCKGMCLSPEAEEELLGYDFPGNFRELESILSDAIMSAGSDNRSEILPEDLSLLAELKSSGRALGESSSTRPGVDRDLRDIPLKGIIDYADGVRASIVEKRVRAAIEDWGELKLALKKEGVSKKEYQNHYKKIRTITGKGLKELSEAQTSTVTK